MFEEIELKPTSQRPITCWNWVDFLARERQRILGKRKPPTPLSYLSEREILKYLILAVKGGLEPHFPDIQVAYAGSIGLFINGFNDTYGDLDIFTNCEISADRLREISGLPIDKETAIGLQSWNLNLDIFFKDSGTSRFEDIRQIGVENIVEIDGILTQSADYIMQYNWVFDFYVPDIKNRLKKRPSTEMEDRLRLAFDKEKLASEWGK